MIFILINKYCVQQWTDDYDDDINQWYFFQFQLFLPSAFLILNPYFGGSIQIKNRQRKSQHSYLIHLALIFGLTGGLHILCYVIMHAFPFNPHTITGDCIELFMFNNHLVRNVAFYGSFNFNNKFWLSDWFKNYKGFYVLCTFCM